VAIETDDIYRKHVALLLLYLSAFFFICALLFAIMVKSMWPIVACAGAMQFPLLTRTLDKSRRPRWPVYVVVNELLVFVLAVASTAIKVIVQK
jgi:hypothetical protein